MESFNLVYTPTYTNSHHGEVGPSRYNHSKVQTAETFYGETVRKQ